MHRQLFIHLTGVTSVNPTAAAQANQLLETIETRHLSDLKVDLIKQLSNHSGHVQSFCLRSRDSIVYRDSYHFTFVD